MNAASLYFRVQALRTLSKKRMRCYHLLYCSRLLRDFSVSSELTCWNGLDYCCFSVCCFYLSHMNSQNSISIENNTQSRKKIAQSCLYYGPFLCLFLSLYLLPCFGERFFSWIIISSHQKELTTSRFLSPLFLIKHFSLFILSFVHPQNELNRCALGALFSVFRSLFTAVPLKFMVKSGWNSSGIISLCQLRGRSRFCISWPPCPFCFAAK